MLHFGVTLEMVEVSAKVKARNIQELNIAAVEKIVHYLGQPVLV
jgi:hypothetical protein